MLTVIIEQDETSLEDVPITTKCLEHFKHTPLEINTIILTEENRRQLPSLLVEAPGSYICFLKAGDTLSVRKPKQLVALLKEGTYGIIGIQYLYTENPKPKYHKSGPIDLNQEPNFVPLWLYSYIFHKDIFKDTTSDISFVLLHHVYRYLRKYATIYYLGNVMLHSHTVCEDNNKYPGIMKKEWYLDFAHYLLDYESAECSDNENHIPAYIQYALLALIWFRYRRNLNNSNKHVIDGEYSEFEKAVKKILSRIDDQTIYQMTLPVPKQDKISKLVLKLKRAGRRPYYKLQKHFFISLLQLKHDANYRISCQLVDEEQEDIWVYAMDQFLQKISTLKCNLDLVDYNPQKNLLILEYHIDNFVDLNQFDLQVCLNDTKLPTAETYRYSHTKYFGIGVQKAKTYRTVISMSELWNENKSTITWSLTYGGRTVFLPVNAKKYLTRICSLLKCSYWHFDTCLMTLSTDCRSLVLRKAGSNVFFQELKFYFANLRDKRSILGFGLRTLYWLSRPWMKKKNIWLTYDKLYKGGDCGEYFYKYCCTRETETGITPAYVINGDSLDYKRLKAEGYHPLRYKSIKHYLYYLNASVVFTTHGGVHSFNGLGNPTVLFVQNLLHHDVACIQHGLTVQQLAHNSNRLFNNMKRYYCASKYEVENLSRPIYGYEDKSALRLTGIPRYDGLVNHDMHQILITPTWRNYIAMPGKRKNQAKPYFPGFKDTDYFKIYNRLLSDEKLISTARETGYRLIYLLHPVISAQLEDYPQNSSVEIIPSLTVNYEKILTESSLMVTDYSGVQFDFAYMRKPIVYYHPPKLPPHYQEGGFFYDTMGFGEICTTHEQIVTELCSYMKNHCQMKPFYLKRQDDFFAFNDLNSCQRIYDDMLAYQHEKSIKKE